MYRISSSTSTWTFETSYNNQSYLNNDGLQTLQKTSILSEVLNPLRANCFHELISNCIQPNHIVFGPLANTSSEYKARNVQKKRMCNLYKASRKTQWEIVKNTTQNLQEAKENHQLEIYDFIWFKFKNGDGKLYFYSKQIGNICQISIYWTRFGESYLLARRRKYNELAKEKKTIYGPEFASYKYLPKAYVITK